MRSWNPSFVQAGFSEPGPIDCLPLEMPISLTIMLVGMLGLTSYMTNPVMEGLLGYGPSVVDFRSGEILVAHCLLGLKPFVESTSVGNFESLINEDNFDVKLVMAVVGLCWMPIIQMY